MADPFTTPGAFSWVELTTTDVDAARRFYGELFGWQYDLMPMGEGPDYNVIKVGKDDAIGGIMAKPAGMPAEAPPSWTAYVTVEDADLIADRASQLGGTVLMPPTDIPRVGRMTLLQDPQGAVIAAIAYSMP